jgi:hypothetical protein
MSLYWHCRNSIQLCKTQCLKAEIKEWLCTAIHCMCIASTVITMWHAALDQSTSQVNQQASLCTNPPPHPPSPPALHLSSSASYPEVSPFCPQLFEESARQVRKEAFQHADQVNKALRQQVEAGLDKKADVSVVSREGQSSRQQLTDLWAEAEAARAGLDQVKGGLEQVQGRVEGLQDKAADTKVGCTPDVYVAVEWIDSARYCSLFLSTANVS